MQNCPNCGGEIGDEEVHLVIADCMRALRDKIEQLEETNCQLTTKNQQITIKLRTAEQRLDTIMAKGRELLATLYNGRVPPPETSIVTGRVVSSSDGSPSTSPR